MSTATSATAASQPQGGFSRFWRTLKQLFHELVGALFAVLALSWLNSALRAWNRDVAHWVIGAVAAVAVVFIFFSITSFRRARKL